MANGVLEKSVRPFVVILESLGDLSPFFGRAVYLGVKPPFRLRNIFKQMEFIGVNSLLVVVITGLFTGMVLALQSSYGFRKFGAESAVAAIVALSMTRELGPVLTSLMVTGRAGSAMTAELATMRATEQIDALRVMALNPIEYLVAPRMIASFIMLPVLTSISNFVGIIGGYIVGVKLLGINEGSFLNRIEKVLEFQDISNGLIKSAVFGIIMSIICCYKGFYTQGGAAGVGKATTEAVVASSLTILVADYVLTSLMF
jgi:phospholipid/cholesterol/gamma-HCH transport system permease protein